MWLDEVFHRYGGQRVESRRDGAVQDKGKKKQKNITDVFKTQHTTKHDGILSITSTFYPTMMVFYVIIFSFALDWKGFKDKKKQIKGSLGNVLYLSAALNKHAMNSPGSPGRPCSMSITKEITICGKHRRVCFA